MSWVWDLLIQESEWKDGVTAATCVPLGVTSFTSTAVLKKKTFLISYQFFEPSPDIPPVLETASFSRVLW